MLVSILTPSFNQDQWLRDCLGSVAAQTYPRIEHIVRDGGSTDGSVALLEASSTTTWTSEPDAGQADALNKAFAGSSGELIGWLNSDDAYFDQRVVADMVEYFRTHPTVDVAYGHAARVNASGRIVYFMWAPPFNHRLLRWMCYLYQPAVFIRRRALSAGFLDAGFQFAMDWELWLRLESEGRRFARINRVLAIDRAQPGRKMKTWVPVLEAERPRLAETYGVSMPFFYSPLDRAHHIATRLGGARLIHSVPNDLAFSGTQDRRWALLRRQVASRQSRWPPEDR